MRQKQRNRETEEYVARKQVYAMGGGIELDDVMRAIDAKGGDYYKAELNPNPDARDAYNHFGMTGRADTLALQAELADEMRAYYGLGNKAQRAADPVVRPTVSIDAPMRDPVIDAPPPAPPTNPEAQAYKDEAMQQVIDNNEETIGESIRKYKEENDINFRNSALAAAVGLGGIAYHQSREPEEEEVIVLSQT